MSNNTINFKSVLNFPIKIIENSSFTFALEFAPKIFVDYTDSLIVEIAKPCNNSLINSVTGLTLDRMTVSIPELIGKISTDTFSIPVRISYSGESTKSYGYKAKVSYDPQLFHSIDVTKGKLLNRGILNGDGFVEFSDSNLTLANGEKVLNTIRGTILLGDKKSTPLKIEKFEVSRDDLFPEIKDGRLDVIMICKSNLSRIKLMSPAESVTLAPQPASESLQIIVSETKEENARITIYTLQGEKVLDEEIHFKNSESKEYIKVLSLSCLNSGMYLFCFDGMNLQVRKPLVVLK